MHALGRFPVGSTSAPEQLRAPLATGAYATMDAPVMPADGAALVTRVPVASALAAPSGSTRVAFVDVARSLAVFGSVLIHALLVFDVWGQLPVGWPVALANGGFRACAPTFYLLFGMMLEWVYVAQVRRGRGDAATLRLLRRSAQCWTGFILGCVAAAVAGNFAWDLVLPAIAGRADAPLVEILRFYACAMLVAVPLVIARARSGIWLPAALMALIWGVHALLPRSTLGGSSTWLQAAGALFSWLDLTIVLVGMVIAWEMRRRLDGGRPAFSGPCVLATAGICVVGAVLSGLSLGWAELARGYLGNAMSLRVAQHPAYYLIGTLSALAVLWTASRMRPIATGGGQRAWALAALGSSSLTAFTLGNLVLNLVPRSIAIPLSLGVVLTIAYMAALCVAMRAIDAQLAKRGA